MSGENQRRHLDFYYNLVFKTVLNRQNVITGLIASDHQNHAYIRDNTYAVMCVWSLMLAYKKVADIDEERARLKDLEGRVVKCMRSLLVCMMRQADKVERFKRSRQPVDAVHCKFSASDLTPVTGDGDYGHLQLDAISLYLLTVAQMTASGLVLIYTPEEVAFLQNLVFYIDAAYMVCDYGIWERGDKTNHGLPELNSTSIGMSKAALEAMSELDLFGSSGGSRSFVHVMGDDPQNCAAVLENMLPRESCSKETDAGLLSVISYPAFAVDNEEIIIKTRECIINKLEGRFGCCRFLRDGYRTALEDGSRLHYEPWELKKFENIECEWPLFFCYLLLDALFYDDAERIERYSSLLDKLIKRDEDGLPLLPESYAVASDLVDSEYASPKSQDREAVGSLPHLWSQSIYIICQLIKDGFLRPQEIDPIGRRLALEPKPDLMVQVVVVAEDARIKETIGRQFDIRIQDFEEIQDEAGIRIYPARVLGQLYRHLGRCPQLGLSGRQTTDAGILATSRLYLVGSQTVAFTPQFLDHHSFYLSLDVEFLLDLFRTDVAYLRKTWSAVGRPLFIIPVYHWYFNSQAVDFKVQPALYSTLKKLQSGYINGTRVTLGHLADFVDTSCVTKMSFLDANKGDNLLAKAPSSISIARRGRTRLGSGNTDTTKSNRFSSIVTRQRAQVLTTAVSIDLGQTAGVDQSSAKDKESSRHKLKDPKMDHADSAESLKRIRSRRNRQDSEMNFTECNEANMVDRLQQSEDLYEQFDIVYQLYYSRGLDYNTNWKDHNGSVTIRELIKEIYERAGAMKQWALVRYTAGMLDKKVENLTIFLTDLLVRQKQVTIGLPPEPNTCVLTTPQSPAVLGQLIKTACSNDLTLGMLTQEVLIYLSMLAKTEPQLFANMYRIRVGLIIQVMGSEMGRSLDLNAEEATEHLLNLSPFEMKTLLHHILSGKEFDAKYVSDGDYLRLTILSATETEVGRSIQRGSKQLSGLLSKHSVNWMHGVEAAESADSINSHECRLAQSIDTNRHGQWIRRRKIDGALNRVPSGFYKRVWCLIERSDGISIVGQIIGQHLTREMTAGEVKFALQVECIITAVPVPEYRQLIVEALSLLVRIPDFDTNCRLDLRRIVRVEQLVHRANLLFLKDQAAAGGDAKLCCVPRIWQLEQQAPASDVKLDCGGACGICLHFYDTAPSGRFGTLTYLLRAIPDIISVPYDDCGMVSLDCPIQ